MLSDEAQRILNLPEFREILEHAQRPGPRITQVDQDMEQIRSAHTSQEVETAIAWVLDVFADMIRHDKGTNSEIVYFASFTNDKDAQRKGWCMSGDGRFIHTRGIPADKLALYYIDVILDDSIETDEDKVWAMIDNSKNRIPPRPLDGEAMRARSSYPLHPELLFLIGEDGELEMWIHGDKAEEL